MTDQQLSVEQVDPATLLVDTNIRGDAALDKDFLASIRELGVLVPIVAVRTETGALRVRYGHRRTLAAVQVGRGSVPVIATGDDADQAARIVRQWHENERRAGLSTGDKVAAVEQLSLLGLSAGQIVEQTRARKADVEQALATAGSALAKRAATRYEFLTLDQAAAVAEFDSEPDTVKALIASAKTGEGEFAHTLQRARDERDAAAKVAELCAELAQAHVPLIDRPGYDQRRSVKGLEELVSDKGKPITPAAHSSCAGHAAYIANDWRGPRVVYVCTQWTQAGHRDRFSSGRRSESAPMSEADKQQRREVIANNKTWKSAETVRREWLRLFLTRKSAPKGAAVYLAGELARGVHELRRGMEGGHQLAATLLGLDPGKGQRDVIATATANVTDARAVVIALAVVLGDIEDSTGTHTWRNPSDTVRRYFAFLAENGYALSDVEQLAAGGPRRKRHRAASNHDTEAA